MADRDSKESCPSPRPMAFTVDFGSADGDQDHKKLALRDSIGRFAPAKIKNKLATNPQAPVPANPASPAPPVQAPVVAKDNTNHQIKDEIILDEENNIKTSLEEQTAVSDAGTYTIDDEEEDPKDDLEDEVEQRDKDIHRTFGLPSEKVNSREWVSVWASNSFAEDNPIQEEEDIDQERSSSSQRRRLPPTPLRQQNGYQQHKDNHVEVDEDTNEYLRDTISLMTAMEARISSADDNKKEATTASTQPNHGTTSATTPSKRRPKTSSELRRSSNNSAAVKAKEAKEKAAQQWQRRKNYDPLKSMAKARVASASGRGDQYTDESSDVESAASYSQRGGPTNPRIALIRSDGGRHSLRQHHKDDMSSSAGPQSLGSPVRRPPFKNNVMSQNGGRSTSSLSSKEAEFQAWKRRKNYNPMRSATAGSSSSSRPTATTTSTRATAKATVTKTNSSAANNHNSASESRHHHQHSQSQLQKRSASFHYPDGTSRVTHSVYSSEEDFNDEDEDDEEPRLYEVNDDELFLAYDSGGVVAPRRHRRMTPPSSATGARNSGAGSTSSTQSGSKLEALDNLVISTIFSVSTKLCLLSGKLVKSVQERTTDKEEEAMLQTLLYVLEDIDPPVSPSKKTSRELAGTLRNLKKVEQALQSLERSETDL